MPTIEQIRAARALLGWSQHDLADKAGLSQTGIARIENGTNQPNSKTIAKIETAFDAADVEFLDNSGVRKRTGDIKTLRGSEGMYSLMNDIYDYSKTHGGQICLFNARPVNWLQWVEEDWFYNIYSKNMAALKDKLDMRIIAVEGETDLISKGHAINKLLPKAFFVNENRSIYIYGSKIAFINFYDSDLEILILESKDFAAGIRVLFNIAWDEVAISTEK